MTIFLWPDYCIYYFLQAKFCAFNQAKRMNSTPSHMTFRDGLRMTSMYPGIMYTNRLHLGTQLWVILFVVIDLLPVSSSALLWALIDWASTRRKHRYTAFNDGGRVLASAQRVDDAADCGNSSIKETALEIKSKPLPTRAQRENAAV